MSEFSYNEKYFEKIDYGFIIIYIPMQLFFSKERKLNLIWLSAIDQ